MRRLRDLPTQWSSFSAPAGIHRTQPAPHNGDKAGKVASTQAKLREARKEPNEKALPQLVLTHGLFSCGLPVASLQELTVFCLSGVSQVLHWPLHPTDLPLPLGICRLGSQERAGIGVGSPSSQVVESPVCDSFSPLYVSNLFLFPAYTPSPMRGLKRENNYFMV